MLVIDSLLNKLVSTCCWSVSACFSPYSQQPQLLLQTSTLASGKGKKGQSVYRNNWKCRTCVDTGAGGNWLWCVNLSVCVHKSTQWVNDSGNNLKWHKKTISVERGLFALPLNWSWTCAWVSENKSRCLIIFQRITIKEHEENEWSYLLKACRRLADGCGIITGWHKLLLFASFQFHWSRLKTLTKGSSSWVEMKRQ